MADSRTIEKFLSTNSSLRTVPERATLRNADLNTRYRPDKLFPRDDYMKWDLIFNNIDTPYRLANRAIVAVTDRRWLKMELAEQTDFKI